MEDNLVVKQEEWNKPINEALSWNPYEESEPSTFPAEGSEVWVAFDNGRSGPATFHSASKGHFSCFNAPWGALVGAKPVRWIYMLWSLGDQTPYKPGKYMPDPNAK